MGSEMCIRDSDDYLQIDLGSVYVVCAVATQGNPSADDWTETYKMETSLDNVNWQWYRENNRVKVCMVKQRSLVFQIGGMRA